MCRTVAVERDIGSYRKAAVTNSGKLIQTKKVKEVYQKNVGIQQEGGRMSEKLQLEYYYGIEAEQFSFYRVPRLLIKDERFKKLSSDAKLLYGLMLDRMSLSIKHEWVDEKNRAYIIYTIDSIKDDLGCSKDKAVKVLAELDSVKGIGLIEKIRRGLGKPDIIYVKNFASLTAKKDEKEPANPCEITEVGKTEFKKSEKPNSRSQKNRIQEVGKTEFKKSEKPNSRSQKNRIQEVGKTEFKKSENQTSRSQKNRPLEVGKSDPNYTNINYTNMSYINHINQSEIPKAKDDVIDRMDDYVQEYIELIKENIEYDHHMKYDQENDREIYDELFQVICDVVCVKRETVKIAGEDYPYALVQSQFLKLKGSHLEYVIFCMKKTTTKITNIKAYMITALYNAPTTLNHFYQQEVQHNLYGCYQPREIDAG